METMKKSNKRILVSDIGHWVEGGRHWDRFSYNTFVFKPVKGEKLKFAKKWRAEFVKNAKIKNKPFRRLEAQGFTFLIDKEYPQFSKPQVKKH